MVALQKKDGNSTANRLFYILMYTFLIFCIAIIVLPLMNVVAQSFSSPDAVVLQRVTFWPVASNLDAYKFIFKSPMIMTGFGNTIFYAVAGTMINILVTTMAAYPLSRKGFVGRGIFTFLFTFTMLFNGGMIPTFLLIKSLGMLDTRWVMIVPGAITVWNLVLAKNYLQQTIPEDLYEAADIDGANDAQMLTIVIPLVKPIIAVITLFYAVGHWNAYFNAMLYLSTQKLFNLQLVLRNTLSNVKVLYESNDSLVASAQAANFGEVLKYAIIVFTSLPIMMVYPFVQKYFVKGIMVGGLKG